MIDARKQTEGGESDNGLRFERWVVGAFVFQFLFLTSAAFRNHGALNTDAIAYLQIAEYWAEWNADLMVSGYWGPLLSWLMAPFIKAGVEPMIAARIVMVVSGVVFLLGCKDVFRAFEIDPAMRALGLWIAAAFSVFWSVRHITPDLLLAGLMALAIASTVDRRWLTSRRVAALAGVWWGLAYLAKAIAFPLAGLTTLALAGLFVWFGAAGVREAVKRACLTWIAFGVVAAPWVLILSLKYGGPTFSTSGRINHAIAGPPDVERYHPFAREFHLPDKGRVTQWEDPSKMDYKFWSPFAGGGHFRHQVGIVGENVPKVLTYFSGFNIAHLFGTGGKVAARDLLMLVPGFDLAYLGLVGLIGCFAPRRNWRERFKEERWRWAALPVALMAGLYLPVYLRSDDLRYFYPAFPLVWVAACGVIAVLARRFIKDEGRGRWLAARVLAVSFGLAAGIWTLVALVGVPNAGSHFARDLAQRMEAANLKGPIAGSATLQGGRAGLYAAWFLNEPWLGDDETAGADGLAESGASVVVATRFDSRVEEMEHDRRFEDIGGRLFASEEMEGYPLRVFRVVN